MPLFISEGISGKMILPLFRPDRQNKSSNIFGILCRLIARMRKHWKKTRFIVRGDAHFCSKEFMDWADQKDHLDFTFGLTGNQVLSKKIKDRVQQAQEKYEKTKEDIQFFHSLRYQAGSCKTSHRVIVKIEVNNKGTNIRYHY